MFTFTINTKDLVYSNVILGIKVQGLSLREGVVNFNLEKQKSFNQG